MAGGFVWTHSDRRHLLQAALEAAARAEARAWSDDDFEKSDGTRISDLRALLAMTAFAQAELSTRAGDIKTRELTGESKPPPSGWPAEMSLPDITKTDFASEDRSLASALLAQTWMLVGLAGAGAPNPETNPVLERFRTAEDSKPVELSTGIAPLAAIGVIVIVAIAATAQTIATIYVAQKTAEVIDRELSRQEDTKRMVAQHTHATGLLLAHRSAEEKAGKDIPFNEGELTVLRGLASAQVEYAKKRDIPLASQVPLPSPGDITNFLMYGGIAAAALVLLYLVTRQSS